MYLLSATHSLPKHAAAVLKLGANQFVFEDTRYFGRLTFDCRSLQKLGPEPLDDTFTAETLFTALKNCRQPIKVALLDQSRIAGIGNIYASEALFRAELSPRIRARKLTRDQVDRLWKAIRQVLSEAIERGSTIPLDYAGLGKRDGLFYFGHAPGATHSREERLCVYDRTGKPCLECGTTIKRLVQAARSTFYCPRCQRSVRKS
jgi:formamidopyrimidine-DNA glycosylase